MWIKFRCLCSTTSSKDGSAATQAEQEQARPGNSKMVIVHVIATDVPELSQRELKAATDKFSASRLIGRGAHAEVFRATLREGWAAAAKRLIRTLPAATADAGILLRKQVAVASRLRHENVVRLLGYSVNTDLPVLLYELAGVGTLHDVLHGPTTGALMLSWEQRVRIALDAARGLAYLHEAAAAVARHDVRSTNVLLFEGLRAKIAGHNVFKELAPPVDQNLTVIMDRRTEGYRQPELLCTHNMSLTPKSDVYSFGVVLLELLTGRKPFDVTLPPEQRNLWSWATPLLEKGRVQECIDPKLGDHYPPAGALKLGRIAVQCLQENPTSRPSMDTVARLINCDVIMQHQHGVV